jgi:hypothetical protein
MLTACGGSGVDPLVDCAASGTATLKLADGTTTTSTIFRCIATDQAGAYVFVGLYSSTPGAGGIANTIRFFFNVGDIGYTGDVTTIAPLADWSKAPAASVWIIYETGTSPFTKYTALPDQKITLMSPLGSKTTPWSVSSTLAATGIQLQGGATLDFTTNAQLNGVENFCHPYASGIIAVAKRYGCQGANQDPKELEQNCNDFVEDYARPASCQVAYMTYLDCAIDADQCNPCRTQYCALNTCLCRTYPPGQACLSVCF